MIDVIEPTGVQSFNALTILFDTRERSSFNNKDFNNKQQSQTLECLFYVTTVLFRYLFIIHISRTKVNGYKHGQSNKCYYSSTWYFEEYQSRLEVIEVGCHEGRV